MGIKGKKFPIELYPNFGNRGKKPRGTYDKNGNRLGKDTWMSPEWVYLKIAIEGKNYCDVAKEAGCSADCMRGWARKHGIVLPSRKEALATTNKLPEVIQRRRIAQLESYKKDPTLLERRGEIGKKKWDDPEYKKKMKAIHLERCKDPKEIERMKKIANRPDVIKKKKDAAKRRFNNPEWVEWFLTKIHSPEIKEKKRKSLVETNKRPDVKARRSKAGKEAQNRPEVKAKISRTMNLPEVKAKHKQNTKKAMNRPEVRARFLAGNSRSDVIARRRKSQKGNHWKLSKGVKRKMKIAWEKRAESSGYPRNYLCPNFNLDSIMILKALDKVLHVRSRYGGMKAGEKKIGRYFVDYFNSKYKFIVEWNESAHYDNNNLKECDIKKKKYIMKKCPDYTYIIIKQDDWFNNGDLTKEIENKIMVHILEETKIF